MDENPCFLNVGELIFERTQSIWRRMRTYQPPPPVRAHTHTHVPDTPAAPSDACDGTRVPLSHVIAHLDEYTSTDIDAADAASSDSEPVNTCACACVRVREITAEAEATDTQTRREPRRRMQCSKCRPAPLTAFQRVAARVCAPSQPHTHAWQLVRAGTDGRREHVEHGGVSGTGDADREMKTMGGDSGEERITRAAAPQIQSCVPPPLTAAGALDSMCARVWTRVSPQRRAQTYSYRCPERVAGTRRVCAGLTQWLVGAYEGDSTSSPAEFCGIGLQTAVCLSSCVQESTRTCLEVHRLSLRSDSPNWTAASLLLPHAAGATAPCGTRDSVLALDMQRLANGQTPLAGVLLETGRMVLLPAWHFASAASGTVAGAVSGFLPRECRASSQARLQMCDATPHATIASGCHLARCCIEEGRAVVDSHVVVDDVVCSIDSACSSVFGHSTPMVWALTCSGGIMSWDTRASELSRLLPAHDGTARSPHAPLTCIKYADWCMLAGTAAGGVVAWDIRHPKLNVLHFEGTSYGHGAAAVTAISCDGLGLITGHKDGKVITWSWEGSIAAVHRSRPSGVAPITCVGIDVDVGVGLGAGGDAVVLRYE